MLIEHASFLKELPLTTTAAECLAQGHPMLKKYSYQVSFVCQVKTSTSDIQILFSPNYTGEQQTAENLRFDAGCVFIKTLVL